MEFYIASYGRPSDPAARTFRERYGDGVYRIAVTENARALEVKDFYPCVNPSYLLLSSDGRYLYVCHETEDYRGELTDLPLSASEDPHSGSTGPGSVGNGPAGGAVSVLACGDRLRHVQTVRSGGTYPCHMDLHAERLFVANYGSGSYLILHLEDGRITGVESVHRCSGSGPDPLRQEASHVHWVLWDERQGCLRIADLGADRIYRRHIDEGGPKEGAEEAYAAPAGDGPRSLTLSRNGDLYVTNELSNTVAVLDPKTDRCICRVGTLAPDFAGRNWVSELHFSPDERYLYVGNRGEDSIVVFRHEPASEEGRLLPETRLFTGGAVPRSFIPEPTGRRIIAANQEGDSITIFERNGETFRRLHRLSFPKPYCIRLARPAAAPLRSERS